MDHVQIRFFDSILTPWRELMALVTAHPIATNPNSNKLTVAADTLATTLRHFKERHTQSPVSSVWIGERLLDWADSAKHGSETGRKKGGQDYSEKTVSTFVSPSYEHRDGNFRFIRNEVMCAYLLATGANAGRAFSAIEELWAAIENYARALSLDVRPFAPGESSYGFLPVAVAFHVPELAAYTNSVRMTIKAKGVGGYEPCDPPECRFIVLESELVGSDLSAIDWDSILV